MLSIRPFSVLAYFGIIVISLLFSIPAVGQTANAVTEPATPPGGKVRQGIPPDAVPQVPENDPVLEGYTTDEEHYTIANFGRTMDNGDKQTLLQLRTAQTTFDSAWQPGRGTIRFIDAIGTLESPTRVMEMGWYEWGAGIFTQSMFEFWTSGVSIRNLFGDTPSYLGVRDLFDQKEIRLQHDGTRGILTTAGLEPGGIAVTGNGPVSVEAVTGDVSLTAEAGVNVTATDAVMVDAGGEVSVLGDGAVTVESRAADLTLRGASRITIDGNGPVSIEGTGSVTVEARTGAVDVISPLAVNINAGIGPVRLQGDGVVVDTPTGALNVQAGSLINLTTGTTANIQAASTVDIKSLTSSIAIDAASSTTIEGGTAVNVNSAGPVTIDGAGAVNVASDSTVAVNGNGTVSLQSAVGNVTLHSASTDGEVRLSAGTGSKVRVDSTGSLHVPGEIYLKGQLLEPGTGGVPTGPVFGTVTPLPSYYSTVGGTGASWTVEATDAVTYGYTINGDIMTVWFVVAHSTVVGAPNVLTIAVPENRKALVHTETFCNASDDNATYAIVPCLISDNESKIRIYRQGYFAPWPTSSNTTSVRGTITFPLMPLAP